LKVKKLCPNNSVLDYYSTKSGSEIDGINFVMNGEKENQTHPEVTK